MGADNIADIDQDIGVIGRNSGDRRRACARERHGHARSGRHIGIVGGIGARAAVDRVIAGTANEGVVAARAIERIIAVEARKRVIAFAGGDRVVRRRTRAGEIARARIEQVFDIGVIRVAEIERGKRGTDRVDAAAARFRNDVAGIVDDIGIVARAANEVVGASAAIEPVIAIATRERVDAGAADDRVVARAAIEAVARGVARNVLDNRGERGGERMRIAGNIGQGIGRIVEIPARDHAGGHGTAEARFRRRKRTIIGEEMVILGDAGLARGIPDRDRCRCVERREARQFATRGGQCGTIDIELHGAVG